MTKNTDQTAQTAHLLFTFNKTRLPLSLNRARRRCCLNLIIVKVFKLLEGLLFPLG